MDEKKLHDEQEKQNRDEKQTKKEDYERDDLANVSEIESDTK